MAKAWKELEKRVASFFGVTRTPFSGGNSGITSGDIVHPSVFAECKYSERSAVVTLLERIEPLAAREGKRPTVAIQRRGDRRVVLAMFLDDFDAMANARQNPPTVEIDDDAVRAAADRVEQLAATGLEYWRAIKLVSRSSGINATFIGRELNGRRHRCG